MIETEMDRRGKKKVLASQLGYKPNVIYNALSGYRIDTPGTGKVLNHIKQHLESLKIKPNQ